MKPANLVLAAFVIFGTAETHAQPGPSGSDSTLVDEALQEYQERIRYGFFVDPFSVYSTTYGFGLRGLATVYNLPFTGSRLRLQARPYQRRGLYSLTLRSHDPADSDVFGLFRARFESTGAYRYYGIGSGSSEDNRLFVDMDRLELLFRLGIQLADDRYMIQPFIQYTADKAFGLDIDDDPSGLDLVSSDNLDFVLGQRAGASGVADNSHRGFKVGLSLVTDYRDRPAYPTSGARASLTGLRYFSNDDFDVTFNQFRADGQVFIGLSGDHVLAFRALMERTVNRGEDPIPFYLLPEIDYSVLGGYKGHRLIDDDMLVLTAEYRWPVVNITDLYQVSGFAQAGVGNVYQNIDQVELSVSFDRNPGSDALRPGFGLGIRVAALEQGRDLIYWMLGVSPEGVTVASFRFVHSLTDIQ